MIIAKGTKNEAILKYKELLDWDVDYSKIEEIISKMGLLIDYSYALKNTTGTFKAIKVLEKTLKEPILKIQAAKIYSRLGNAYSDLETIPGEGQISADWENKNRKKSLFYFRKSLIPEFSSKDKVSAYTNLGNMYDFAGRHFKSLEIYDSILIQEPSHFMTLGNKGIALIRISTFLSDNFDRQCYLFFAYKSLHECLKHIPSEIPDKEYFNTNLEMLKKINIHEINEEDLKLDNSLRKCSPEEELYVKWCRKNRLFLTPLNDLGDFNGINRDVSHLPTMAYLLEENPHEFPSLYNQLKQEFTSARYFLYEGLLNKGTPHFSDKENLLINPLDYPKYSLNVEKIKISFRMAYSIFDKISFFVYKYLKLSGKEEYEIDFRKVWYTGYKKKELNPEIINKDNLPLRGLFSISEELLFHGNRKEEESIISELKNTINPEAKKINELRNKLEHSYVKVHDSIYKGISDSKSKDSLSYSIYEEELEKYSLEILKLVREALLNLVLFIHIEEFKEMESIKEVKKFTMQADIYEDEWKF